MAAVTNWDGLADSYGRGPPRRLDAGCHQRAARTTRSGVSTELITKPSSHVRAGRFVSHLRLSRRLLVAHPPIKPMALGVSAEQHDPVRLRGFALNQVRKICHWPTMSGH